MRLRPNSYNFGSATDQLALRRQMASHLEHLAGCLRGQDLQNLSLEQRLDYVKVALAEHSASIQEN